MDSIVGLLLLCAGFGLPVSIAWWFAGVGGTVGIERRRREKEHNDRIKQIQENASEDYEEFMNEYYRNQQRDLDNRNRNK